MTTPTRETPRADGRRRGRRDGLSLVPAIVPLGIAVGVTVAETSIPPLLGWLAAPLLIAGAAQVVLVTQLDAGTSVLAAAAAALLVNARFVVYGAALAPRFATAGRWFRWLAPHAVVDQTYALVSQRVAPDASDEVFRAYFAAAALPMALTWALSVGIGVLAGPVLPAALPLDLVLPVMFVALVVPGLRERSELAVAAIGTALAVAGPTGTTGLAAVALAGAVIGGTARIR